ncbi:peptidase S8/S53 domain-containing protein [Microdochium bolleyi]|uniref:Peptidase S8/S53 domain-containing protein n=1 Tax=Microdochium bolleyi TaxID=196109 RepID=A0A136JCK6_9PEZI|nr:peptidase S8/S53 domain-containing protein [Microdochium bolleyi]
MRSAVLLSLLPLALAAPVHDAAAPLIMARKPVGDGGKYIVRLKTPAPAAAPSEFGIAAVGAQISSCINSIVADAEERFDHIGAFSARLDESDIASLRANPNVAYIEQDGEMSLQVTQTDAPWGLGRISNVKPGSTTYTYEAAAGSGACVYVIDSGVDVTHPELEGRAVQVANTVDTIAQDQNGHGTHVAGIVASKTYGVAKKAKVLSVKVFDASGRTSNSIVLAGMDFVISDSATRKAECPAGLVVNMSLGGNAAQTVDDAANRMVAAGLAVIVAAGNGDRNGQPLDASTQSPARAEAVCTIGATDSSDVVGAFSNYGPALDLHAPGVSILSLAPNGQTQTLSGTSMATPHVAGLAAYFLSLGVTTPTDACTFMASKALNGVITGLRADTKNILVQNILSVAPPLPTPTPSSTPSPTPTPSSTLLPTPTSSSTTLPTPTPPSNSTGGNYGPGNSDTPYKPRPTAPGNHTIKCRKAMHSRRLW